MFTGPKMQADPALPSFTATAVKASQTGIYFGMAIGGMFATPLADRVGRLAVTYGLTAATLLGTAASMVAASYDSVMCYTAASFMMSC